MRLIPDLPVELETPLRHVLERCLAQGLPEPPWLAVETGGAAWQSGLSSLSGAERARGVVVVHSEEALRCAHRLGVGGAAWLPASTPGLGAALEAAEAHRPPPHGCFDLGLHELQTSVPSRLHALSFRQRAFWQWQAGDAMLRAALCVLAEALEATPTIFPWPALLVGDRTAPELQHAWQELQRSRPQLPRAHLLAVELDAGAWTVPGNELPVATAALAAAEADEGSLKGPGDDGAGSTVCTLPEGRAVGVWSADGTAGAAVDRWLARPVAAGRGAGFSWRVQYADGRVETVDEVSCCSDLDALDSTVCKLPGHFSAGLRAGSPAALLIDRLTRHAARRGVTLWISNVDEPALRFLLRLRTPLWVDGPEVPGPT